MATGHTLSKGPDGVAEPTRIAVSYDENELKPPSVDFPTGPAPAHSRSDSANAPIALEYDDGLGMFNLEKLETGLTRICLEVYDHTDSKWLIPVPPESGGLEVHRDTSGLEVRTGVLQSSTCSSIQQLIYLYL